MCWSLVHPKTPSLKQRGLKNESLVTSSWNWAAQGSLGPFLLKVCHGNTWHGQVCPTIYRSLFAVTTMISLNLPQGKKVLHSVQFGSCSYTVSPARVWISDSLSLFHYSNASDWILDIPYIYYAIIYQVKKNVTVSPWFPETRPIALLL